MNGYAGQLLEVDLTAGTSKAIPLDPTLARDYIGGRPLGIKLVWDYYGGNWAAIDPLGPDAVLAIMEGPLNGFVGGKAMACFKSPLSGGAMGSAVSGDWNAMIRFAGYDGVIIKGKSSKPVYLYIEDDKVEIRDAAELWGKDTLETHDWILKNVGPRVEMLYIGPAGEKMVKFASIMTAMYRACGRGGSGAVMGSKNLKAIVVTGTKAAPAVADAAKVKEIMDFARINGPIRSADMHAYGTASIIGPNGNVTSAEPVRNWQEEWHSHAEITGQAFAAEQWIRRYWADYMCTVACSKLGTIKTGAYAGCVAELPDYEGGAYCGPNLGVYDINDIAYLCDVTDKLGLDVISCGNVLAFAAELYQRGVISQADLGGIDLQWGSADAFDKLMQLITKREGIGNTLADGTWQAAKAIGKDTLKYGVQVKGIEVGAHGQRSLKDYTAGPISYALSCQGGDHTSIAFPGGEMWLLEDTLVVCGFWTASVEPTMLLDLLNATTGFGITNDELNGTMQPRWVNLQRATQLLAGWTAKEDDAPPRFYEPLPDGPYAGQKMDTAAVHDAVVADYTLRGWDAKGIPTTETLQKYGLGDVDKALAGLR